MKRCKRIIRFVPLSPGVRFSQKTLKCPSRSRAHQNYSNFINPPKPSIEIPHWPGEGTTYSGTPCRPPFLLVFPAAWDRAVLVVGSLFENPCHCYDTSIVPQSGMHRPPTSISDVPVAHHVLRRKAPLGNGENNENATQKPYTEKVRETCNF